MFGFKVLFSLVVIIALAAVMTLINAPEQIAFCLSVLAGIVLFHTLFKEYV